MSSKEFDSTIKDYVVELCHRADFRDREWYWEEHVSEVVRLCEKFGPALGADMSILRPAALLHDLGKLLGMKDHAKAGAGEVERYLSEIAFPETTILTVAACIREHSFDPPDPESTESRILASCDGASHFTTLFWERYFFDVAKGLFSERDPSWRAAVESNAQKALEDWEKIVVSEIREYTQPHFECFKKRYALK